MPTRKTKSTTKVAAKKNPWRLTHIPLLSWISFWVCISATLVLISVTFTSALSFAQTPEENADTVVALQQLGDALEKKADAMTGGATKPEGRVMTDGFVEDCDLSWATSTAETYVSHLNEKTKVRGSFPYSFAWGNEKYVLEPVVDNNPSETQTVEFGPAVSFTKCGTSRDSSLEISSEPSTPNQMRSQAVNEEKASSVRERSINGMTVLSYRMNTEVSSNYVWIAFGRTFRYRILSQTWLTDAEAVKIIQSLRVEN